MAGKRNLASAVLLLAATFLGCHARPAASNFPASSAGNTVAPEPRACVTRLGDPSWAERERAMGELLTLGEAALPALQENAASADPEVRWRVAWLLRAIPRPVEGAERTGPLAQSESWRGTIRLTASVVVPEGLSLTLEPGCRVVAQGAECRLQVEGTLVAHGTAESPIDIGPEGIGAPGAWDGVQVRGAQASASLRHCRLHGARIAAYCLRGRVFLEDCELSSSTWGVYVNNPSGGIVRSCAFVGVRTPIAFPSPCPGVVFEGNRVSPP